MSRKARPVPIWRCSCGYWERRNGEAAAGCPYCNASVQVKKARGNRKAGTFRKGALPMTPAMRVEPAPTPAVGTIWEDL